MAELGEQVAASVEGVRDPSGLVTLSITGELDLSSVEVVQTGIEEIIKGEVRKIIFDLGGLTFMDSTGIALMLQLANRVGDVEVHHASLIVRRVIEATGLSESLGLQL